MLHLSTHLRQPVVDEVQVCWPQLVGAENVHELFAIHPVHLLQALNSSVPHRTARDIEHGTPQHAIL